LVPGRWSPGTCTSKYLGAGWALLALTSLAVALSTHCSSSPPPTLSSFLHLSPSPLLTRRIPAFPIFPSSIPFSLCLLFLLRINSQILIPHPFSLYSLPLQDFLPAHLLPINFPASPTAGCVWSCYFTVSLFHLASPSSPLPKPPPALPISLASALAYPTLSPVACSVPGSRLPPHPRY